MTSSTTPGRHRAVEVVMGYERGEREQVTIVALRDGPRRRKRLAVQ